MRLNLFQIVIFVVHKNSNIRYYGIRINGYRLWKMFRITGSTLLQNSKNSIRPEFDKHVCKSLRHPSCANTLRSCSYPNQQSLNIAGTLDIHIGVHVRKACACLFQLSRCKFVCLHSLAPQRSHSLLFSNTA